MNKKIPFDIKYRDLIESGKWSVQTNDGRKVRVICWNKLESDNKVKLVALVPDESTGKNENVLLYYPDGSLVSNPDSDKLKLVVVTDQLELDEFEQTLKDFLINGSADTADIIKYAEKLRKISARSAVPDITMTTAYKMGYEAGEAKGKADGYEKGFKAAQKDMTFRYEPSCPYGGGICNHPFHDCISCPRYSLVNFNITTTSDSSDNDSGLVVNRNPSDTEAK